MRVASSRHGRGRARGLRDCATAPRALGHNALMMSASTSTTSAPAPRRIGPFSVFPIGLGCMNFSHAYAAPPPAGGGWEVGGGARVIAEPCGYYLEVRSGWDEGDGH